MATAADDSPPPTTDMADDEDAQPKEPEKPLKPCAVCARKFNPDSLAKHVKICERTAARKRKPFDSAKQRIQGTELAEFLPKHQPSAPPPPPSSAPISSDKSHEPSRRAGSCGGGGTGAGHAADERTQLRRPNSQWKQTRDEFLRAIRAARGDTPQPQQPHQTASNHHPSSQPHSHANLHLSPQQRPSTLSLVTSSGAPTRSNEKGQCPTCQRQFGVKSYDRHVAFCRERSTRLPASPQTSNNVAKERLEARMKYRAPAVRNRRPTNREKYSPGGGQKVVAQSPLMARSPMKDAGGAGAGTKVAETNSPKLPILKRPGQSNKESPAASNGPLKSRPVDRSNRHSDSQESLNPPAIRQIFSSRRLLLLSEVLPSKSLQPKPSSLSSSSSQRSSARLVSQFLQKEFTDSPVGSSAKTERKSKKKAKLKNRSHRKVADDERVESTESVLYNTESVEAVKENRDFVTWRQIQEDAKKRNEVEGIDKVEMLSDLAGLSSFDEGNSTTDEFEYNERMVRTRESSARIFSARRDEELRAMDAQIPNVGNEDTGESDSGLTINRTFIIDDTRRLGSVSIKNENTFDAVKNTGSSDDDDDEDGLSSASTKTFRKSYRQSSNDVDFVDSLDLCHAQENSEDSKSNENKATSSPTENAEALESAGGRGNDVERVDENKAGKPSGLSKEIGQRLLARPKKCHSMPNITDARVKGSPRVQEAIVERMRCDEKDVDRSSAKNRERITVQPESSTTSSLRRGTYVIDESRTNLPSPRHHQHQRLPTTDSSSDETLPKPRPKLQSPSPSPRSSPVASKNETPRRKSSPEAHRNKADSSRRSLFGFDYYRNEAANFSDATYDCERERWRASPELLFDEDFAYENESNASELIREIDVCLVNSEMRGMYASFSGASGPCVGEESALRSRPWTEGRTRRSRKARSDDAYPEREFETSVSTIELTDLSAGLHRRSDTGPSSNQAVLQHLQKEICTITRLDPASRDVEPPFLPSIESRPQDWRAARLECHRERLVKSRPRSRSRRDAPQEDDDEEEGDEFESCDGQRSAYFLARGASHGDRDRRSGAGKDYNPFLLAEQQLNDLFSDTSDQSSVDGSTSGLPQKPNSSPNFPLSHSSAFVKYPNSPNSSQPQSQQTSLDKQPPHPQQQRISLIAPPTGFDDLTSSDLSSDCTETNSLSRELLTSSSNSTSLAGSRLLVSVEREHVLGRRVIIDQNQALGGGEFAPAVNEPAKILLNGANSNGSNNSNANCLGTRVARPLANRSNSMRASSAPKPPERKISSSSSSGSSDFTRNDKPNNAKLSKNQQNSSSNDVASQQRAGNNYKNNMNGSNLSLSSIISSTDMEMKRSNSLFDELLSSFEDDANSTSTLPSLISLMRNDPSVSLLSSAGQQQNGVNGHHHQRMGTGTNGRINCSDDDGEMSSPESVKRQECGGKLSADSAYSSLNRKYSNHGRNNNNTTANSTNDVNHSSTASSKFKLSRFCHECGFKFPDSAKFCCECGVKRLTL